MCMLYTQTHNTTTLSLYLCLCRGYWHTYALNILLDSNPYILNLEVFEIEKYIYERLNKDEELEDIIDDLESNPQLFNEL